MNNWLNQLERKYGRFGIPNLTNILVGGQILVLAIELFVNQTISVWLSLSRYLLRFVKFDLFYLVVFGHVLFYPNVFAPFYEEALARYRYYIIPGLTFPL